MILNKWGVKMSTSLNWKEKTSLKERRVSSCIAADVSEDTAV